MDDNEAFDKLDLMFGLIGDMHDSTFMRNMPSIARKQYALMVVVEREIDIFMRKYPDKAEIFWNMFMTFSLFARDFSYFDPDLFQKHVEEIMNRVVHFDNLNKEGQQVGTYAECIIAFHTLSLDAPLTRDAGIAHYKVFKETLPHHMGATEANYAYDENFAKYESYEGAADEIISGLRKAIGTRRKIEYPTEEQLAEQRKQDEERGNKRPWMEYMEHKDDE